MENWVFWLTAGDWDLDPQGGVCGEVAGDFWGGLDVEKVTPVEDLLFWLPIGDWHLALQGGERGEGDVEVWDWLTIGDWHLEPQGGEHGEMAVDVCEGLDVEVEVTVENWIF